MQRLSDAERSQFKQVWRLPAGKYQRPTVRTLKEYVAFATFAARFTRERPPRLITGGDNWRL